MAVSAPTERGRRRFGVHPALVAASALAVAIHLWGLYRPVGPPMPPWFPAADKLEHVVGFAVPLFLLLLSCRSFQRSRGRGTSRGFIVVVTALFAAHAVISELAQYEFYQSRTGDPADVAADWVGCAIAFVGYALLELHTKPARTRPVR
jgi:cytosine/uracil/thiamine/allantoin permease